ncbi:hypothetical protein HB662_01935 [Roseomonas frigidaquae]|uniref:Glycosyltransferase RgtA/B/C/D-like domain-containing protein n=1 Tax=Falsiroseomonas frigidaquae TaxID=487318 RepID=A0ABX1EVY9_9PROT|nr:hypothetical protein [Falsiroseomonas frigidaquae]NKE43520.1 hypothetical protein [Falsiroseomonas frigidaquae]
MPASSRWQGWGATVLAAALSGLPALLALWGFGVMITPDSPTYLAFAEALRAGPLPVGDALLRAAPAPATLFRTPGYPALLAALQAVAPAGWLGWLVAVQMAAQAGLAALAHRTGLALGLGSRMALLAALLPASGHAMLAQISVMTDALHAALAGGAALLLLWGVLRGRGLWPVLLAGLLLAAATLVREATVYLALAYLPAAVIGAAVIGAGAIGAGAIGAGAIAENRAAPRRCGARALAAMALLLAPVLAVAVLLAADNHRRSGTALLSTSRQIVMVQAVLPLLARGVPVFDGADLFDRMARQTVGQDGYAGIDRLNAALFEAGLSAPEIAALASDRYARTWRRHPAEMLRAMVVRLPVKMFGLGFMPVDMVAELHRQAGAPRPWFGQPGALWRDGSPVALLLLALLLASRAIGFALAAGALLAPLLLARAGDARAWPVLGAWLVVGGYFGVHLPVHLEQRYLLPIVPLVALLGLAGWRVLLAGRVRPG